MLRLIRMTAATIGLIGAVLLSATTARADGQAARLYEDGLQYLANNDAIEAEAALRKSCDGGYSMSCIMLADAYFAGNVLPKDADQAVATLQHACQGGDIGSCEHLGKQYVSGEAVPRDYAKAEPLLKRSCEGGAISSCNILSLMYAQGALGAKDYANAALYAGRACDGGVAERCTDLATLYYNGQGVEQDRSKALAFFQRAGDKGDPRGYENLGIAYAKGDGIPRDSQKAGALFEKACFLGGEKANEKTDYHACYLAGITYDGRFPELKDPDKAVKFLARACLKSVEACQYLGESYFNGSLGVKDAVKGEATFAQGCDLGGGQSCYYVGALYERGAGVPQDRDMAWEFMTRGAEHGSDDAKSWLADQAAAAATADAQALQRKFDAGKAAYDAKRYADALPDLRASCDGGNAKGCDLLGRMYAEGASVTRNGPKAGALFHRACKEGVIEGCGHLGDLLYADGSGPDSARGLDVLQEACRAGWGPSCNSLGEMYENQDHFKRAAMLYSSSCNAGDSSGCIRLGKLYQAGKGVEQDFGKAKDLYQRFADKGDAEGLLNLGYLYGEHKWSGADDLTAADMFDQACHARDQSPASLTGCYEDAETTIEQTLHNSGYPEMKQAMDNLNFACGRDLDLCDQYRQRFTDKVIDVWQGGPSRHFYFRAMATLVQAECDHGVDQACSWKADFFGGQKDDCDGRFPNPVGCIVAALAYEEGFGASKDHSQAIQYMKRAVQYSSKPISAKDNEWAKRWLKYSGPN